MAKKHYHVLVEMEGGYLPDVNEICVTKTEAVQFARESARDIRNAGYLVTGNANDGYYCMPSDASEHTLATLIYITECHEPNCI